eukprot:6206415-Pleurochrysis_carterae.AAC.2
MSTSHKPQRNSDFNPGALEFKYVTIVHPKTTWRFAEFTLFCNCDVLSHSSLGEWRRDGPNNALFVLTSVVFYLSDIGETPHKYSLDIGYYFRLS